MDFPIRRGGHRFEKDEENKEDKMGSAFIEVREGAENILTGGVPPF